MQIRSVYLVNHWLTSVGLFVLCLIVAVVMLRIDISYAIVKSDVACHVLGISYGETIHVKVQCDDVITEIANPASVIKILQSNANRVICKELYEDDTLIDCVPL